MATIPRASHFGNLLRAQSEIETLLRELKLPGRRPSSEGELSEFEEKLALLQQQLGQITEKTSELRRTLPKNEG